jgi:predicted aldo/keto reductase-like oxidoreductase
LKKGFPFTIFISPGQISLGLNLREITLGRTGLKVKVLGFGGIPIQRVSEEEAVNVVRRCYERGINYFDTARAYSNSEERIGKALEEVREEIFLATKTAQRTREGMEKELEISLRNLRTNWIDVYQLHNISYESQWDQVAGPGGALEGIRKAKEDELINHVSITSHNPDLLTEIIKKDIFETIMIPYNYLTLKPAEKLLPLCQDMDVGTIIMKPFGGGAFSKANTALKYVLSNPDADIVIPGMMSIAEVEENIQVASGDLTLTEDEKKLIERDREELGEQFCRACNYCQPCPQEIPISFVLRAENQMLRRMGWSESRVEQVREANEKVDTCIQCGACEERCPYSLPIRSILPEKMDRLYQLMENREIPGT